MCDEDQQDYLDHEKTKSYKLGRVSQLGDLESEFRDRAGQQFAEADSRIERKKAEWLKELAREFENREEEKREQWEENYKE